MTTTTGDTKAALRKGLKGGYARERAAFDVLTRLGWSQDALTSLPVRSSELRVIDVAAGDESLALLVLRDGPSLQPVEASLGYSREAPYVFRWGDDRLELLQSNRWTRRPGDTVLVDAEPDDLAATEDLFSLLEPGSLVEGRPTTYALAGTVYDALHVRLATALFELRVRVAAAEISVGEDLERTDSALLRLFHQLLFIRFQEDLGQRSSDVYLPDLVHERHPQEQLSRAIEDYARALNSELFRPTELPLDDMPGEALGEVLRALVEPWQELKLDFSVSRSEIAGRLYQTYLSRSPVVDDREVERAPTLFAAAVRGIDRREASASYYTPPALARLIAESAIDAWLRRHKPKRPEDVRTLDPACGSGAFLIASYRRLLRYFEDLSGPLRPLDREGILRHSIFGADIDPRALGLAQIQLLEEAHLRGPLPQLGENLLEGDSLLSPPGSDPTPGGIPWTDVIERFGGFSVVVANPPFGAQITLPHRLSPEARERVRERYPEMRGWGSDYAYLFLSLARQLMASEGAGGFVMPRTLLEGKSGRPARRALSEMPVRSIMDFRGLRLFRDSDSYVAGVVLGPGRGVSLTEVRDSRVDARLVLDAIRRPGTALLRRDTATTGDLQAAVESGWGPFRLRWSLRLGRGIGVETQPLLDPQHGRTAAWGTKPGDLARFVAGEGEWREVNGNFELSGKKLSPQYLPRYVRSEDLRPFEVIDRHRRLFLPFEPDGRPSDDPAVLEILRLRGGFAPNLRRGNIPLLTGPKLLLRALAREPAAFADASGEWLPSMGAGGAIALHIDGASRGRLFAVEALLNSALYQWLLRGLSRPKSDESVELALGDLTVLPWPVLEAAEWRMLTTARNRVVATFSEPDPFIRSENYWHSRESLDNLVFELLQVSEDLRQAVGSELVRFTY